MYVYNLYSENHKKKEKIENSTELAEFPVF